MKLLLVLFLIPMLVLPAFASNAQVLPTSQGTLNVDFSTTPEEPIPNDVVKLNIGFVNPHTNKIQEHIDYVVTVSKDGSNVFGPIPLTHTSVGSVTIPVEVQDEGTYSLLIEVSGILFQPIPPETVSFNLGIGKAAAQTNGDTETPTNEGGCLIATAAYGSELSPQVQQLRELRDNTLLQTSSGSAFMAGFNQLYYSFSPSIADLERDNPVFKEVVKLTITPMISSLSLLNYVEMDSEVEVLGFGISLIFLNIGMYFVAPVIVIRKLLF